MPKVSIAMAVKNMDFFIRDTLDSIRRQTFKDFEVIIVDDMSNDNTVNIIYNEYCVKDSRFKLFINNSCGNDYGVDAHNKSLQYSTGEYIMRMDGDDLMDSRYIDTIVKYLDDHPDVDGAGCSYQLMYKHFNEDGTVKWVDIFESTGRSQPEAMNDYYTKYVFNADYDLRIWGYTTSRTGAFILHSGMTLRNNFIKTHNIKYRSAVCKDSIIIGDVLLAGGVIHRCPEAKGMIKFNCTESDDHVHISELNKQKEDLKQIANNIRTDLYIELWKTCDMNKIYYGATGQQYLNALLETKKNKENIDIFWKVLK